MLNLIREELLEVDPFLDRADMKLHEPFKGNKAGRLVLCRRDASLRVLPQRRGTHVFERRHGSRIAKRRICEVKHEPRVLI